MTALQIFLLGIMAAWTPSLVVLAWLIYRAPLAAKETCDPRADEDTAPLVPSDPAVTAKLPRPESIAHTDTRKRRTYTIA